MKRTKQFFQGLVFLSIAILILITSGKLLETEGLVSGLGWVFLVIGIGCLVVSSSILRGR